MRFSPASSVRLVLPALLVPGISFAQGQADAAARHREAARALEVRPDIPWNPTAIIVKFSSEAGEPLKDHARRKVGLGSLRKFESVAGLELLDVRVGVDKALADIRPYVEYAEPDYVLRPASTPSDPMFNQQWALHNIGQSAGGDLGTADADIDAPAAWDVTTGDPSFTVAMIDTGMQWTHPDLAANVWWNSGEVANNGIDDDANGYVDDVRGWDFINDDNDPSDTNGHGTHTAGIVGAVGNNGIGIAGVAWSCKLMPLRFLGTGGGYTSDAVLALQYAVAKGARVSNNSWGGAAYSQSLRDAIDAAKTAGHLFCAAAGNSGVNIETSPYYPASYNLDNVISVAATDNDDARASFSNYGASSVDLGAPGASIASTYMGTTYTYSSGTSMAAPQVAGVAALVWSAHPSWTWAQVRAQILATVRPAPSMAGVTASGGILNAAAALGTEEPPAVPPTAPASLAVTSIRRGPTRVTWADLSTNETGFQIQREKYARKVWGSATVVATTGANVTSFDDAPGSGKFRYRVRSFNAGATSAWTGWVEVQVR